MMKTYRFLILALLFVFSFQTGLAQTSNKDQRKIERAEKKRLKEEDRKKNQELLINLVKDQSFVLEATTLSGRYNQQQVTPSTNFVKIEGNRITIQTANNFSFGYNGLGGITLNGTINDYIVNEGKNGVSVFIKFSDPVLGLSTLNLDVQTSGLGRATILGNWGGRATFQGEVVALEEARVFEGRPII